jgi:raffinose/stachyose/melibiose transport system substrate-binding protein
MKRILLVAIMIFAATFIFAGGSQGQSATGPTEIRFANYWIGTKTEAPYMTGFIERFKAEHPEIDLQVEEIAGETNYFEKMKVLLSANDLPDIIWNTGENMLDMAVEAGALVNFTPYLDADPEWKIYFPPADLDFNTRQGGVYALQDRISMVGYFYNKEYFANAGISGPPKTWPEFWDDMDKLKATGVAPMALHTSDTAWCTGLLLGSIIGTSGAEGNEFMNTRHPQNFNLPYVISALEDVGRSIAEYTTRDAIGGNYANAANNFLNGKAAIIFNGPWMIGDFSNPDKAPAGFDKKVGAAIYPNGGVYAAPSLGHMSGSRTDAAKEASVVFFKAFFNPEEALIRFDEAGKMIGSPLFKIPADLLAKKPILASLIDQGNQAKYRYNNYQALWKPEHYDLLETHLPLLAQGSITAEELATELTKISKQ